MSPKRIYGVASVRTAAHDMLKALDKFERGLRDHVPADKREEYQNAIKQIEDGCSAFLKLRFIGEEGLETTNEK